LVRAKHVVSVGEERCIQNSVEKPEGKEQLVRVRIRREDHIKMNFKK
jgi:hypothetical protein